MLKYDQIIIPIDTLINKEGIMLGDLDNNKKIEIIDVRLLLQKVINSLQNDTWRRSELLLMDMNNGGSINIIDVRLLLQECINQ